MKNIILTWNKRMKFLLLLCTALFVMAGCAYGPFQNTPSEKVLLYEENFEITGSEKDDIIGKVNPVLFETSDRSNALAGEVDIPVVPIEGKRDYSLQAGRSKLYAIEDMDAVVSKWRNPPSPSTSW